MSVTRYPSDWWHFRLIQKNMKERKALTRKERAEFRSVMWLEMRFLKERMRERKEERKKKLKKIGKKYK